MNWTPPPQNISWFMLGIVGLLFLSSMLVFLFNKKNRQKDFSELNLRIKSWWVIVALFLGVLLISREMAIIFFAFLSYLALKEFFSLIPTRRADRRVLFWVYISIPLQYWWIHIEWYGMFIIFIPVYMFLFLPMRMVLFGETTGFLKAVGTLHWGLMTTVFSLSHMAYLLVLPHSANLAVSGVGLVLYLVCLTELNDVAQYVWGKSFGKKKVVPSVSPNKSWAGLIGGIGTTTLLSLLIAPLLTPLSVIDSLLAGLIISVGGFLGDVTVSAVKRDIGIKDTGSILPGHGGILDRMDSLTFTAPLFLHFIRYFYF